MELNNITSDDLVKLKRDILAGMVQILQERDENARVERKYLRSKEVKEYLNITANTLLSLRVKGVLKVKWLDKTPYYSVREIDRAFKEK